jgi:hypothetical protein
MEGYFEDPPLQIVNHRQIDRLLTGTEQAT